MTINVIRVNLPVPIYDNVVDLPIPDSTGQIAFVKADLTFYGFDGTNWDVLGGGSGGGPVTFIGGVTGSGTVPGIITLTVQDVGGQSAVNVAAATMEVLASNTNFTVVYIRSNEGVDDPANGSVLKPLQSLSYAYSLITDSSISKPYLFDALGNFNESAFNPKPYIFVDGNQSILNVNNEMNLDPSWSAGGVAAISNFSNVSFSNNMILDFTSLPPSTFILENFISTVTSKWFYYGNPNGGTQVVLNNITGGPSGISLVNPQDCDFTVRNSQLKQLTYFTTGGASADFTIDSFGNSFTDQMFITNGATNLITFKNFSTPLNILTLAGGSGSGIIYNVDPSSVTQISNLSTSGNVLINYVPALYIGSGNAEATAQLQMFSTTQTFMPPRMTTAQRIAISPSIGGGIVYDTNLNQWFGWNNSAWSILG